MTNDPTPAAAEARATKATPGSTLDVLQEAERMLRLAIEWIDPFECPGATLGRLNRSLTTIRAEIAEAKDGAAPSPEKGWRLVPVEPTEEMILAASETPQGKALNGAISVAANHGITFNLGSTPQTSAAAEAYRAMLAAAPAAPSPDLAALEAWAKHMEKTPYDLSVDEQRRLARTLRSAILHLKAQPK